MTDQLKHIVHLKFIIITLNTKFSIRLKYFSVTIDFINYLSQSSRVGTCFTLIIRSPNEYISCKACPPFPVGTEQLYRKHELKLCVVIILKIDK